ncbi:unnamed protein product [Brassicogethes aeneus]|uniref:Uncharacterized protein n=1 Tax=Brassicogethes aeneus TaxID=1431903 RepID=A0A9P0BI82_BRAAE|nr:unnamed protein product [Brassicogethes aeneus]
MSHVKPKPSISLFKQLWNDWPELVGSHFMGTLGLLLCGGSLLLYYKKDGDFRKHKLEYTVIRDDDCMADKYKKIYKELDKAYYKKIGVEMPDDCKE